METQMLKVKNVVNAFLLFLVGILPNNIISQTNFRGTFCIDYALKDFSNCLTFETGRVFKYEYTGDTGTIEYGKGDYKIEDGNLILNYNKTEPLKIGRHISEIWTNKTDSITVHFVFLDFNNGPIPYVNIFYKDNLSKNGYSGVEANKEGEAVLNLKKEKSDFEFNFSNLGYRPYKISIDKNYNYHITVFLEADGKGIPIKNQIDTLRIVELKDDFFKVKGKDGKIVNWSKID